LENAEIVYGSRKDIISLTLLINILTSNNFVNTSIKIYKVNRRS
jgi:hypothetical protein